MQAPTAALRAGRGGLRLTVWLLLTSTSAGLVRVRAEDVSAAPAPSAAQEAEPNPALRSEYQAVVARAVGEFDAGRFAEARALFLRAHELWPSARTSRTLGMTAFELGMYPRALIELQAALDDPRRALSREQREQTEALLRRTHAFVGRYRVHVTPADAALWLDDAPLARESAAALVLAVGAHQLRARAPGHSEVRRLLQVQGREDEALMITLEPNALPALANFTPLDAAPAAPAAATLVPPPTQPAHDGRALRRDFAYATFAIGAAGVVSGAVLGGLALRRKQSLTRHCPDGACEPPYWHELDQLHRFGDASTATLVIGGVALAAATYLWFSARASEKKAPRVHLGARGLGAQF